MTQITIQVDAEEFWPSLQNDIRSAQDYVYLQTMSFEGDSVGEALAGELIGSGAADRRVIADEFYTIHRINDNFLHNPKHWFDRDIRDERDRTLAMHASLERAGVRVKLTNPAGPIVVNFLRRNHKKLVAIDDRIAYIGGINFTEHNFSWHDMMLRIEHPDITRFLKEDFLMTWRGEHANTSRKFEDVEIYRFDGYTNPRTYQPLLELMAAARKSVYIVSPYIAYPFYAPLRTAIANGAKVVLLAPDNNNWRTMREYVIWESVRAGVDLQMYRGRMVHLKAMLIDDEYLVAGSSNFDFLSSELMQEVVAVITNKQAIAQFKKRVLDVDLAQTEPNSETISSLRGLYHISRLKLMPILVGLLERVLTPGRRRP